MATAYTLISSVTVGSGGAATVSFSSIPSTYTDLCLFVTSRCEASGDTVFRIRFNSDSGTNYKWSRLLGDGSSVSAQTQSTYGAGYNSSLFGQQTVSTNTANTFSNAQIYIPNYASSNYKSASIDAVTENNATAAQATLWAGLWENTSAITAITLSSEGANDLAEYSTAYLYGISNA
jgi:hypothetical protein